MREAEHKEYRVLGMRSKEDEGEKCLKLQQEEEKQEEERPGLEEYPRIPPTERYLRIFRDPMQAVA